MVMRQATGHGRNGVWTLAELDPRDIPEMLEIERASFPNPWSAALFLQELRLPFSRTIVARERATAGGARPVAAGERTAPLVGYLCRWFVADETHILNVAVHLLHRRRGIAAMLLDETLREARALQSEAVTLEVRRGNAGARRLYEALRFEEVGVRRNYYGSGEDALIMRLALNDA
jgi:ribosomal-protein-alanine N-acetyltransferase